MPVWIRYNESLCFLFPTFLLLSLFYYIHSTIGHYKSSAIPRQSDIRSGMSRSFIGQDYQLSESCINWKFFPKGDSSGDNSRTVTTTTRIVTILQELQSSFSHHLHMLCVNFIQKWREQQFKVNSELQIFEKLFIAILFTLTSFLFEIHWAVVAVRNIISIFRFVARDVWAEVWTIGSCLIR